jgi:hypothetical protein
MRVRKIIISIFALLAMSSAPLAAGDMAQALSPSACGGASKGAIYGGNIFSGALTGALIGGAAAAIPYAESRHNQDPKPVAFGAAIGGVAVALGLGVPISAYETGHPRLRAGNTLMTDIFSFGVMGGAAGAALGTVSYRNKVGTAQSDQAEDFLAAGGAGVCAGALLGLALGIYDIWVPESKAEPHPPGNGLHARLGIFPETALLPGDAWFRLKLLDADF